MVFAGFGDLPGQAQVVLIELPEFAGEGHIAGADLSFYILHDSVHCDGAIPHQFAPHGEHVKLFDPAGGTADAEAEQHVEFQAASATEPDQRRHVQRFEKRHHRIWRFRPGCGFRICGDWLRMVACQGQLRDLRSCAACHSVFPSFL